MAGFDQDYQDEFKLIMVLIEMMAGVIVIIGGILIVLLLKASLVLGSVVCIVGGILIGSAFLKLFKVMREHQKY
jgi:uncharacterized membrane protein YjjP (DUF1212 family)